MTNDELKPCPFCGGKTKLMPTVGIKGSLLIYHKHDCFLASTTVISHTRFDEWQSRQGDKPCKEC